MKRTQKKVKSMIKADVDAFIAELMNKYPEIAKTSLETYVAYVAFTGNERNR